MAKDLVPIGNGQFVDAGGGWLLPELIEASGARVRNRILDYLGAKIENDNTRFADMRVIAKSAASSKTKAASAYRASPLSTSQLTCAA